MVLTTLFLTTTLQFGLPAELLPALCYIESTHNINAIHHDDGKGDSLGICQVKLETAKSLGFTGTVKQLMNPKINVHYAGKYLAHQILRYNGDVPKALTAYNRGSAKALTHSKYSVKVTKQWEKQLNVKNRIKK